MSKFLFIVHDIHQEDNHFPLGTAYLAAVLEKEGHHVDIICQDITHEADSAVCRHVIRYKPDIVGIGFLAARFIETVVPLCEEIRGVKKDAKLILGGHGATGCPDYVREITDCDDIVTGEGEQYFSSNGCEGIDGIPFPAWHLFPIELYKRQLKMPGWEPGDYTLGVISSRGCVGKCTFCQRLSKGLRMRSMESVVEEISQLYSRYGINYIFFQDEMFVSSKKRMVEFHDCLNRKGLLGVIKWGGDSRVDAIDREMLEILKATNVQFLDYGFESMDENVLKLMKKKTTPTQNEVCADLTRKAGVPFNINMLWGMPGDSLESLRRNISFIKTFDTHSFLRTIRPPTPYPGCELFDMAVEQGKLTGPDDFFKRFSNSDRMTVNFTDLDDREFYMNLYWANAQLVRRYYNDKALKLTDSFYSLYFKDNTRFRGARHYA